MALMAFAAAIPAQSYTAPAGDRPALRRAGPSILPGGRIVAPLGEEFATGPGAFAIAVSTSGRTVVTANSGPFRYSFTVIERASSTAHWQAREVIAGSPGTSAQPDPDRWAGVSQGVALSGDRDIYLAEGDSGRVVLFDSSEDRRRVFDLNQGGYADSFSGDLALDRARGILYVADQANFRIAAIDLRSHHVLGSVRVGRLPFALALAPDGRKLYVANCGMFEYRALAGAPDRGLSFPPFGFPSAEAVRGVELGGIAVPGLGEPNAPEADSVAVVDVANPAAMKVNAFVRTGLDFGGAAHGGSGPSGILAAAGRVFVSNSNDDSISIIDPATNRVEAEIPIRIPGLETLRGVIPLGLAWHEASGWLLVAEAGINAVGVIDVRSGASSATCPPPGFPPAWRSPAIPSSSPTPAATAWARTRRAPYAAQPAATMVVPGHALRFPSAQARATGGAHRCRARDEWLPAAPPIRAAAAAHPPRGDHRQGEPELRRSAGRYRGRAQWPRDGRRRGWRVWAPTVSPTASGSGSASRT
jgi:YVTN family beta-propeller protein